MHDQLFIDALNHGKKTQLIYQKRKGYQTFSLKMKIEIIDLLKEKYLLVLYNFHQILTLFKYSNHIKLLIHIPDGDQE